MERLTERMTDGILVKEDFGEDVLKTLYQCYGAEPMLHYANCDEGYCAMEKLAEYEDFEEIFRSKMTDAVCDILKDKEEFAKWLDRNRWIAKKCDGYARAEDQGKLLKLPTPVGSLVYEPYQFGGEGAWEIDVHRISLEDLDKIGKTVFLTREEAEATLKDSTEGDHAKTSTTIQK